MIDWEGAGNFIVFLVALLFGLFVLYLVVKKAMVDAFNKNGQYFIWVVEDSVFHGVLGGIKKHEYWKKWKINRLKQKS